MDIRTIWQRRRRPTSSHRLGLDATEVPDGAVARLGRGTRPGEMEAEQKHRPLRAGGAAAAYR